MNSSQIPTVRECDTRGCRSRTGVKVTEFGEFCLKCMSTIDKVVMLLKTSGPEGSYWTLKKRKNAKDSA